MPEVKREGPLSKRRGKGKWQFILSESEKQLLRKVGRKISKDLYDLNKSSEWLGFKTGISRSTVQEIIAGRSNLRLLTLNQLAQGLDYKDVFDFLGGF